MGVYDFIIVLILTLLEAAVFYYIVWAIAHVILWSGKKIVGMLSGPARRNLEAVRTKKDLAEIQVGALTAAEGVMKLLARADPSYRGR